MTGWHLGWVVAAPQVVEPLRNYTSATVFGYSQFIQDAVTVVLENDADYIASIREERQRNPNDTLNRIAQLQGINRHSPEAWMFLLMDVSGIAQYDSGFARQLLGKVKVQYC